MPRPILIVVLCVLAGVISRAGQDVPAGVISGTVDSAGLPLRNVSVYVKRLPADNEREVKADADGAYRVDGLPKGEYQVLLLAPGRFGIAREHVRVEAGEVRLDRVTFDAGMTCECSVDMDRDRGHLILRHHDEAGHRLLRAWVRITPFSTFTDRSMSIGPYAVCVCYRRPETMGREESWLMPPGTYTIHGAAAGYASWERTVVMTPENTTLDVTWMPSDDKREEARARTSLQPGEALVRIETFVGTVLLAIDAGLPEGRAFLDAAARHQFDDSLFWRRPERPSRVQLYGRWGLDFGFRADVELEIPVNAVQSVYQVMAEDIVIGRVLTGAPSLAAWQPPPLERFQPRPYGRDGLPVLAVTPLP